MSISSQQSYDREKPLGFAIHAHRISGVWHGDIPFPHLHQIGTHGVHAPSPRPRPRGWLGRRFSRAQRKAIGRRGRH